MGVISPYMAPDIIREMFGINGPISTDFGIDSYIWLEEE
jgi:hypothetical protein